MSLILITGASDGLGRALALDLAGRGRAVAALARRGDLLQALAAEHPLIRPVVADVADPVAVAAAVATLGEVGVLINNAATYPRRDVLEETAESLLAAIAVNLGGVVAATRAVLPQMVARGQGRILNVTTYADLAPIPGSAAYATGKGAARIFTRALIADIGDRWPGIVVNEWIPGALATGMGVAEGIPPAVAARWGASLALMDDRSLTGTLWDQDREVLPPRGWKRRLVERLTGTAPVARRL
jgi:short-subunit dehydrogenase